MSEHLFGCYSNNNSTIDYLDLSSTFPITANGSANELILKLTQNADLVLHESLGTHASVILASCLSNEYKGMR
jgi:hypothetical protein